MQPTHSRKIGKLSPSAYEVLRACHLRMAFRQDTHGSGPQRRSPAAVIGDICHSTLDHLVRSGRIWDEDWITELEAQWNHRVADAFRQSLAGGDTRFSVPEHWPQFNLKHSRLRRAGKRLREILGSLSREAVVLPEEPLTGAGGRLYGRPDLLIRETGNHQVVEYKTGRVLEADGIRVLGSYERQLQIYAFLEAETIGTWPDLIQLLPLGGPTLTIQAEPSLVEELVSEILNDVEAYNARAPGSQPASPSPEVCSSCPYSPACESFWAHCDTEWDSHVTAVAGHISDVSLSQLQTLTFSLGVEGGTLPPANRLVVRNVDLREHPEVSSMQPGDYVRIVGLREESRYGTQALRAFSSIAVFRDGQEVKPA